MQHTELYCPPNKATSHKAAEEWQQKAHTADLAQLPSRGLPRLRFEYPKGLGLALQVR